MKLSISVKGDSVVIQELSGFPKLVAAGQRRAKNNAASRLRTQGTRRIGQRVHLKASYIRGRIELVRATGDKPARVIGRARETRMDRFPNRQIMARGKSGKMRKAGIQVRIKRGRPPITITSAFYVPLRRGQAEAGGGLGIALRMSVLDRISRRGQEAMGYREDATGFGGMGEIAGAGRRRYAVLHASSIRDLLEDELDQGLADDVQTYYAQQVENEVQRAIARGRR